MRATGLLVFSIAYIFLSCTWATVPSSIKVFEILPGVPRGWKQGMRASPNSFLKFSLAICQPRREEFERRVVDIATPDHPLYGQHLSKDEIESFLRPSNESFDSVIQWLDTQGIHKNIERAGNWIKFKATVAQAERMFDTEFYWFYKNDLSLIRILQYSLPSKLHHVVQLVQPTTRFADIKIHSNSITDARTATIPLKPLEFDPVKCNSTVTPGCLRGLYQLNNFTANPHVGNKLGISGYLEQYARHSDLEHFLEIFAPYAQRNNFSVESIDGGLNLQGSPRDSGEASLDIQYGVSLSADTPVTYYSTAGRGQLAPDLDQPTLDDNQNEPYLEQLQYLLSLSDEDLPSVLSTSYGEDEQSVPISYAHMVCNLFAQLGARGVSVIFSSGDMGVGSACQTNDGKNTTRFSPVFPASCPFVTSVGGTQNVQPEIAASFSSGGFSDIFPRPQYQEQAVCNYLSQLGEQWRGLFNPQGRGFPDVAAQSVEFYVYDHNTPRSYSGTSCASPVFAAIITNMNSIRFSLGLPSLGFLNPFLYSHGSKGLTDIVDGGSIGCTGLDIYSGLLTPFVPYASWNATVGWDPVTGLGTPIFPKLVQLMFRSNSQGSNGTRTTS